MKAYQAEYPVAVMCRLLGVSRSGYYQWLSRPLSNREVTDRWLTDEIKRFHRRSGGSYGAPRIHVDLADAGIRVGRKRVARLMRLAGITGVHRRRTRPGTTRRDRAARPAPDLLCRDFTASGPNQKWVADIKQIPTREGKLYLASVLDVWSRRNVGWALENHMRAELVLSALEMAITRRRPRSVIHHSDQGSQYTAVAFTKRCEHAGIARSMGSVGDAYDNAMAESFFATLQTELLDNHQFETRAEARSAVFAWIEGWYNPHRRHSSNGQISPIDYERRHTESTEPKK